MSGQATPEESEKLEQTKTLSNIDFRFSSESHGSNITLSKDGQEAHKREKRYSSYNLDDGVYIATPLRGICEFEVEVTEWDSNFVGSMTIGVSQCPKGTYKHLDIPYKISHTKKDSCVWQHSYTVLNGLSGVVSETKYGSMDLGYLKTGDTVTVKLSQNGELNFFLNGLDQGLAARNVYREGWDLYPVIRLGGSCSAVKITRAVISKHGRPPLKGHSKHFDVNISLHNIQFGLHQVTGENIRLLEDGLYARRTNPANFLRYGIVYGAVPITYHGIILFEIIITEYEAVGSESIEFGVMRLPSNTEIEQSTIQNSNDDHFVWRHSRVYNNLGGHRDYDGRDYGYINLLDLREGDKVGLHLSSDGTLSFFVNGKNQGVALRGLHKEGYDIYPLVDICFDCHAVRITRAEIRSEEVQDLQELCVEKIASCLGWSSKDMNLLPLPQRLKNQIEHYIDYL